MFTVAGTTTLQPAAETVLAQSPGSSESATTTTVSGTMTSRHDDTPRNLTFLAIRMGSPPAPACVTVSVQYTAMLQGAISGNYASLQNGTVDSTVNYEGSSLHLTTTPTYALLPCNTDYDPDVLLPALVTTQYDAEADEYVVLFRVYQDGSDTPYNITLRYVAVVTLPYAPQTPVHIETRPVYPEAT